MIIDERYRTFLNSMETPNEPFLEKLYEKALSDKVPVIRRETQGFLKTMLAMVRPKNILEVGAGVGFSALLMAQYAPEPCHITTIENYAKRIKAAKENIASAHRSKQITLIEGDAANELPKLDGEFDMIFMDAAKGQYINFLPEVKRLIKKGGIIISDNVLQDGCIIESHYIIRRRDRTIHKRMREYLYTLTHDEEFSTTIIPLGDGIALSVKR